MTPETDTSPLDWLDDVERRRRQAGLRRSLRSRAPGGEVDLASNDYLGLSQHPEVIDAGVRALRTWGAGSTGSRLVTGNTELHEEFECALAEFVGAPAALLFSSGYTANLGALVSLSGQDRWWSPTPPRTPPGGRLPVVESRVVVAPHRDVAAVRAARAAREEGVR